MKSILLVWGFLIGLTTVLYSQNQLRVVGEGKLASGELIDKNIRDANGLHAAAVRIKTDLTALSIEANNGVIKMNTKQGEYDVFVSPDERILTIRKTGYVALRIILPEVGIRLKSGQMWEITVTGEKEPETIPVNFLITPEDAALLIDNKKQQAPYKGLLLSVGKHQMEVKKDGYATIQQEIEVSVSNSLFEVELKQVELQVITLKSEPVGATIFLDGIEKGKTNKQVFVYPGKYTLKWSLSGYIDQEQEIEVKENAKNEFLAKLEKNTGMLNWTVNPRTAIVQINKEIQSNTSQAELAPGRYLIELSAEGYDSITEYVEIKRGDRLQKNWVLTQQTGGLQFSVEPYEAKVTLKRNGQVVETWTGLKILKALPVGRYELTAELSGYQPYTETVTIAKDKTLAKEFMLKKGATAGKTITNSIGMEFVLIPAGTFQMGSNDGFPEESPVHEVTISQPFYMGKYEVTQKEWKAVMGNNPSFFKGDDLPVEQVSWYDVQEFIKKLNQKEGGNKYRLPTEAEWEYAARAGSNTKWHFGDEESQLDEYAWYVLNSNWQTHPVGQKKPNGFGLYDVHGNVWERVQDWYGVYPFGKQTDPKGPNSGSRRVYRGGGWYSVALFTRSAFRLSDLPDNISFSLGFRLLRLQ